MLQLLHATSRHPLQDVVFLELAPDNFTLAIGDVAIWVLASLELALVGLLGFIRVPSPLNGK